MCQPYIESTTVLSDTRTPRPITLSHSRCACRVMIKAHPSGRMVSSGTSNVVIASIYSEKTLLKKLMMMRIMMMMMMMMRIMMMMMMMIIITMNKSQQTSVVILSVAKT